MARAKQDPSPAVATSQNSEGRQRTVTLKTIAEHVGLSVGTISALLNDSPSARHIPNETRERVLVAARELDYRPNFFARSLRNKRTNTIGVIAHEIGDSYSSLVIAGIERLARQKEYFFITGIHRHDPDLFERYARVLLQRGAEGIITVDYNLQHSLAIPTVAVAGHPQYKGVTNITLNHERAAWLALDHLFSLGHRKIAFMKGHPASSDSAVRWRTIAEVAQTMGLVVDPCLTIQIESEESSPQVGYLHAKKLIAGGSPFTALFAYNDITALGSMRALQEAGYNVPRDISVIGFDDITWAEYHYPSLTTIRQPLGQMGEIALQTLLDKIEDQDKGKQEIAIMPELVVRESTAQAAL